MRHRLAVGAVLLSTLLPATICPAAAECTVSADAGAVAKPIDLKADSSLVISMSMLPKLMRIDYASLVRKVPGCELGSFAVGNDAYELHGDDKAGRQRLAVSTRKGAAVAQLLPVTNILKAIEASKQGKAAPVEGYLLATVTKTDFTGWRFYTGVPDSATLTRDMAEALGNGGAPIFRNGADGKTAIFLPRS